MEGLLKVAEEEGGIYQFEFRETKSERPSSKWISYERWCAFDLSGKGQIEISCYKILDCSTVFYKSVDRSTLIRHSVNLRKYTRSDDQHLPAVKRYSVFKGTIFDFPTKTFYDCARSIQRLYRERLKHAKIRRDFEEWLDKPGRPGFWKRVEEFEKFANKQ